MMTEQRLELQQTQQELRAVRDSGNMMKGTFYNRFIETFYKHKYIMLIILIIVTIYSHFSASLETIEARSNATEHEVEFLQKQQEGICVYLSTELN